MLEKALEIAAWVQKSGIDFDATTYDELMATVDIAQLWDDKALRVRTLHALFPACWRAEC